VIDAAPQQVIGQVNRLLRTGGRWIYHGSLAFDRAEIVDNINVEELIAISERWGFSGIDTTQQESAYLCCPDSRHGRLEQILTMSAEKVSDASPGEAPPQLPDWIVAGNVPVPLNPAFERQALATRVHAFVMSMIDGRRTLEDMAELMESQRLMPKEEARSAIQGFLIKMFDEASAGTGYD
jgi:hypothetical protein